MRCFCDLSCISEVIEEVYTKLKDSGFEARQALSKNLQIHDAGRISKVVEHDTKGDIAVSRK